MKLCPAWRKLIIDLVQNPNTIRCYRLNFSSWARHPRSPQFPMSRHFLKVLLLEAKHLLQRSFCLFHVHRC